MRDDPDFNILLVSLIEKHRCLFDSSSAEYGNRNIQERAWNKIADEVSATVLECKERWKNLRASFTRFLKSAKPPCGSAAKYKKPYYLAEYLNFLKPFTKSRKQSAVLQSVLLEPDTEGQSCDIDAGSSASASKLQRDTEEADEESHNENTNSNWQEVMPEGFVTPASKKIKRIISAEDANRLAFQYYQSRRHSVRNEDENPDLSFFKSVLPDMGEMNAEQKRRFKIGILNLAQQILGENSESSVSDNTKYGS